MTYKKPNLVGTELLWSEQSEKPAVQILLTVAELEFFINNTNRVSAVQLETTIKPPTLKCPNTYWFLILLYKQHALQIEKENVDIFMVRQCWQ